jgi:hypothetical protein
MFVTNGADVRREDVKKWMLDNLDILDELLKEINAARESFLLKRRVEELEKEKTSQAMSYGRKLAKLEKERDELKGKLGLPVEPKKTRKKKEDGVDPLGPIPVPATPSTNRPQCSKPPTLSERLAGATGAAQEE